MSEKKRGNEGDGAGPAALLDAARILGPVSTASHIYVQLTKDGNTRGASDLLKLASTLLKKGRPLPAPLAMFLADRLDDVANSRSPWGVPLLKRERGRKDSDQAYRNVQIAYQYWRATEVIGDKGTGVIKELARDHGLSEEAVKHAIRAGRRQLDALPPGYLEELERIREKGAK